MKRFLPPVAVLALLILGAILLLALLLPSGKESVETGGHAERHVPDRTGESTEDAHAPPTEEASKTAREEDAPPPPEAQAGETLEENERCVVRGRVLHEADSRPIPDVPISFSRGEKVVTEVRTSDDGSFEAILGLSGDWTVKASPCGPFGAAFSRELRLAPGAEQTADFLVPAEVEFKVFGRVTDEFEQGMKGVDVRVYLFMQGIRKSGKTGMDGEYGPIRFSVKTDSDDVIDLPAEAPEAAFMMLCSARFTHPDYASLEKPIKLNDHPSGEIRLDVRFRSGGVVSGVVVVPDGGNVDGTYLSYSLERGNSSSSTGALIRDGRFTIKIAEKGRLVIENWEVGDNHVAERIEVGEVDTHTFRNDLVVHLKKLVRHRIRFVDGDGELIRDRSVNLRVMVETEGRRSKFSRFGSRYECTAEVYSIDGVVKLPLKLGRLRQLDVFGTGIVGKEVPCTPETLPDTIEVEFLPPLLTGTLVLPTGVGKDVTPRVQIVATSPGTRCVIPTELRDYEPTTGSFTIDRLEESEPVYTYKVTISIPGYKSWIKEGFKAHTEGLPPHVTVTFDKN